MDDECANKYDNMLDKSSRPIQTATLPSRWNFSRIASSSPFIASPPYFLFYESRDGHDVPVVVSDCVRRVRRYAVRSARSLCRGKNKSRNDVDRVVCRIGQINDVTESLSFGRNTGDCTRVHLLHR